MLEEAATTRAARALIQATPRGKHRLIRLLAPLFRDRPVLAEPGVYIYGRPDEYMDQFVIYHRALEPVHQALRDLITPGMTVIDVGAHVGLVAIACARRGAEVHAFEPNPDTLRRLRDHIALNEVEIAVNPVALSNSPGTRTLYRGAAGHDGGWTFAKHQGPTHEIQVDTLDDYRDRHRLNVDLIKIDVEGAEAHVLRGARQTLTEDRPLVILEVRPELLGHLGASVDDLLDLLAGYKIERFEADWIARPA
jgi:FkbM family methyltransferase